MNRHVPSCPDCGHRQLRALASVYHCEDCRYTLRRTDEGSGRAAA